MSVDSFELVHDAVASGLVPGAALGLITPQGEVVKRVYGVAARVPEQRSLTLDAQFDLASLTKVLFTTREILRAVEDGLIDLDTRLINVLPELSQAPQRYLSGCTPRNLLAHTARLPATIDLYRWSGSPVERLARVLTTDWTAGERSYSDVGYIILGMLLERLRGAGVWLSTGAGLSFAPDLECAVSTETCPWRGRTLRGEVHDKNAAALGGRAGHAGLFGTLEGVLLACQQLLERRWVSRAAHEEMVTPHTRTHLLGWERKHRGWNGGCLASSTSFGHTGFTGTGCWIDPQRGLAWALLTNAVHPQRQDPSPLIVLRRAVGNAISQHHG